MICQNEKAEKNITVKCPNCGFIQIIPVSKIHKSWSGEYFTACNRIIHHDKFGRQQLCNTYIAISPDIIDSNG